MKKQCSQCKEELSLDNFYKDSTHKDGLTNVCKKCWNKKTIENRKKRGREHENLVVRIKEEFNRQQLNDQHWKKICKFHNLDYREIKKLYKEQNGKCYYCTTNLTGYNIHIEHYYPKRNDKIVLACCDCNRLKWQRTGDEFIVFLKEYISRFS